MANARANLAPWRRDWEAYKAKWLREKLEELLTTPVEHLIAIDEGCREQLCALEDEIADLKEEREILVGMVVEEETASDEVKAAIVRHVAIAVEVRKVGATRNHDAGG